MYILFYGADVEQTMVFVTKWQSYKSPYKDIRRLENHLSVFLYAHARRRQIAAELFVFFFFFPPFCLTLFTCETQCCQIVLAWGRTDYVCVCVCAQSVITSLRIDYYSSGLGSQAATEEATKTLDCTAWRCCCVYLSEYCHVISSLFAAKWQAFAWRPSVPVPVSPRHCVGLRDTLAGHK